MKKEEEKKKNSTTMASPVASPIPMPVIRLQLDVVDRETWVQPGRLVPCRLLVSTNTPIVLLSASVRLVSEGECREFLSGRWPHRRLSGSAARSRLVRQESYVRPAVTTILFPALFLGAPPPSQPRQVNPRAVTLHVGRGADVVSQHPLLINLQVPVGVADTWSFSDQQRCRYSATVTNNVVGEVFYCLLDSEGLPFRAVSRLKAVQLVVMTHGNVPVERFADHGLETARAEAKVGWPWSRGVIQCQLTARDRLVLLGQDVPLTVHIDNHSPAHIRKVSLALIQELTFQDSRGGQQHRGVVQGVLLKDRLPPVGPHGAWHRDVTHFTVPAHCLSSNTLRSSYFATLRFLVQLKVKWRGGSVRCAVEVHVGHHFRRPHRPPPSFLQTWDVCTLRAPPAVQSS